MLADNDATLQMHDVTPALKLLAYRQQTARAAHPTTMTLQPAGQDTALQRHYRAALVQTHHVQPAPALNMEYRQTIDPLNIQVLDFRAPRLDDAITPYAADQSQN